MSVSYPKLAARTQRFTLGIPRNLTVSPDGAFVRFLRTPDGVTSTGQLWQYDVAAKTEQLIFDPLELDRSEELSDQERARRERRREAASGIVDYDVDATGRWACFALSGRLYATHLAMHATHELAAQGPVIDPRLDPTGRRIAYCSGASLRVIDINGENDRVVAESDDAVWGQAEFIAAEEMDRHRGFWWAPDGKSLLVESYDDSAVPIWHIADPANPQNPAREQRYPAAGSTNATVSLWRIDLDGTRTRVDLRGFEYLARVSWNEHGPALVQLLSRDQKHSLVCTIGSDGSTTPVHEISDDTWVDLGPAPQFAPGGRLVVETGLRSVDAVFEDCVIGTDWDSEGGEPEPTRIHVYRLDVDGTRESLTEGSGVHAVVIGGPTTVIVRSDLESTQPQFTVHREDDEPGQLATVNEPAPFLPEVRLVRLGERRLSAAIVLPRDRQAHQGPLPILMDPYGGPHGQRVLASARVFLESQWLADQGFCVVVADGRGTPGRGKAWDRELLHDFASITLQDQVDAVEAVTELLGDDVDPNRVGITGWSYGGYLAALAVLDRPDVFSAAVAGAPVTDWRLYDTCYTERYLGNPHELPEVYEHNSLLPRAAKLERPLMLIHGLADDNVVAAHTLRLSSALLSAGRPHTVLPLSAVTHMTPQEEIAENLKLLQLEFFTTHLQRSQAI